MKYIDAEKLIAEIERRIESWAIRGKNSPAGQGKDTCESRVTELSDLLSFITSLQQEHPEGLHFTPLNRLIQKIPSENWNDTVNNYAKKLRDCLIKEGYLKDAEVLQGYISYMNGNNIPMATMDEQEQQEVDWEKEYKSYMEQRREDLSGVAVTINMKDLARHFFELGLNAGMEKSNGVNGVVHHALKSHWIVTDKKQLATALKVFPEGAEVELFIFAKKEGAK